MRAAPVDAGRKLFYIYIKIKVYLCSLKEDKIMHNTLYISFKAAVVILLCTFLSTTAAAQNISVSSAQGQSINTFVQNNLVGSGVYVYNVKFNNSNGNIATPQIGTFNANGYTQLRMSTGVIMTTGNVSVAPGPNGSGSQSTAISGFYSDSQMNSVASGAINACATLDFDFVSVSPFITVNYCFGSEEYPEYVCSSFNDVFAFFITGLDPSTGQSRTWNMAKIPHTVSTTNPDGIAVAVNSVNQGSAPSSSGSNCYYTFSEYYVINHQPGASGGPNGAQGVQYDGFTQKLSASAQIVPCAQYHMHISICNVGDNAYDSGVFIEQNSFNSPSAQINLSNYGVDTLVAGSETDIPLSVYDNEYYTYGRTALTFQGTAANGVDYYCISSNGDTLNMFNNVVNISGNGHHLRFIAAPGANIVEPKTIRVTMRTSLCESHPELSRNDTLRLIMVSANAVSLRDTVITCADTCREVGVQVAYAAHPLTFRWDPQTGIDYPTRQYSSACIYHTTQYHVIASDSYGNRDTATVDVIIENDTIPDIPPEGVLQAFGAPINVYPNPAAGQFTIEADGLGQVELYNSNGQQVANLRGRDNKTTVNTELLPSGVYTIHAITAHGNAVRKVLVLPRQ